MRWKRRRLLWRSFRARHQLTSVIDRTGSIVRGDVLVFATLRDEVLRLPGFLRHYRALGVAHFLIVDNGSSDGSLDLLRDQQDVSLWQTGDSYRAARFGLDWLGWLLMRYGAGHWCLTVDADELLIYPDWDRRPLPELTARLDALGQPALGALMLEPYPKGPLGTQTYSPDQPPTEVLEWVDPAPYRAQRQAPMQNLWVQGGVRERVFFADRPQRSPTLNKLPLVKWQRRYAYVNSTHAMLPPPMNLAYDGPGDPRPCGVLLHTKFLPSIVARSETERGRAQHFTHPNTFGDYYDQIAAQPDLWHPGSVQIQSWQQLADLGLMSKAQDFWP